MAQPFKNGCRESLITLLHISEASHESSIVETVARNERVPDTLYRLDDPCRLLCECL